MSASWFTLACFFFFSCYCDHRDLHSFPTRRSSDLITTSYAATAKKRGAQQRKSSGDSGISHLLTLAPALGAGLLMTDRKSTRLNSSHVAISYAVFCLKKKKKNAVSKIYVIYTGLLI